MRCDDCQALLLDHLYGLLDGPEAVALDAHLAGCAGCTAAREQAARVRGLFARAAKSSFPDVRFVPPAQPAESAAPVSGPPLAEPAPAPTAPFGRRPARRAPVGWAAGAVVLVLTHAVVRPARAGGRDEAGRVASRPPTEPGPRPQTVRIPAEVWAHLKPQSALFLGVAAVDDRAGRTELIDRVRLFGPVYATMLVTDKATYRPGERVFFRSLTLDRVSFRPPDREQVLRFELRKVDALKPVGELVGKLEEVGVAAPVRVADG